MSNPSWVTRNINIKTDSRSDGIQRVGRTSEL